MSVCSLMCTGVQGGAVFREKVIVYDKVLGLGATDPITGDVGTWAGVIITTYFGGRTIEKVARIFKR